MRSGVTACTLKQLEFCSCGLEIRIVNAVDRVIEQMVCRTMLESSTAAQCPSVAYQLAGAKKVQQDLASPGVVERFVDGEEEATIIRACFAGTHFWLKFHALCGSCNPTLSSLYQASECCSTWRNHAPCIF